MERLIATWLAASIAFLCAASAAAETGVKSDSTSIPYVPTRHDVVKDVLWLADVGKDDVVYDLGSGDGRIVIAAVRDFGAAKAIGIEIDSQLVRQSRLAAEKAGVADRVEIVEGDLFVKDLGQANVVVLYLGHRPNIDLRAKLYRSLKPGARIVTHQFGMGEWPPDKFLKVKTQYLGMFGVMQNPFADNPRVPDFGDIAEVSSSSIVRVWIVPAAVAGIWRGNVSLPDGERELILTLHQRLGEVTGSFQLQTAEGIHGGLRADLWGDQLRFDGHAEGKPYSEFRMMFDGHVSCDTIQGTLALFEGDKTREYQWKGNRGKSDFTGAWEWTSPTGLRPVQLRIERREGQLVASYTDREETLSVGDFFEFGGGFYFTHRVGRQPNGSTATGTGTGWLVGEAIAESNGLSGTIEFYPYPGAPNGDAGIQQGPRAWLPKHVQR